MAAFFYSLGLVVALLGVGWCGLIIAQPAVFMPNPELDAIGRLLAMAPGFAVLGVGLVFLAIGGVLGRLDKIVEHTAR